MEESMSLSVEHVIMWALECSVYHSPREPGLTCDELIEVASRLNFRRGEIIDGLRGFPAQKGRHQLPQNGMLTNFSIGYEPEYRNALAFDFVISYLQDIGRLETMANAMAPRNVIVANAIKDGIPENDVEVAITLYLHDRALTLRDDGMITFPRGRSYSQWLPSHTVPHQFHKQPRSGMAEIHGIVKDVIQKRTSGRPVSVEPLIAFGSVLESLGHGRFRVWWTATCDELQRANPSTSSITICVLAAALSEGALTFVVKRARDTGSGTLASKTFNESPTRWSFDELLSSASKGGPNAILDPKARDRADRLCQTRQWIHPGRLLADNPSGPLPGVRPEEAREALESVNLIVRRVLDWIESHPV
jgi:hypothetical protein